MMIIIVWFVDDDDFDDICGIVVLLKRMLELRCNDWGEEVRREFRTELFIIFVTLIEMPVESSVDVLHSLGCVRAKRGAQQI